MAEIVNLRMARKRALRRDEESKASANRTAFGLTKAAKGTAARERQRAERILDGHELDRGAAEADAGPGTDRPPTDAA